MTSIVLHSPLAWSGALLPSRRGSAWADSMSLAVTAWRLARGGERATCIVSARDGRWHVTVEQGKRVTIAERCASGDEAFDRATQIWQVLIGHGWSEPRH